MNLSEPFIRKPVMTAVLTVSAMLFGVLSYRQLPVNDLPAVDYPVIQVQANDPADTTSRNNIRMHLAHITQAFQNGDFDIPMFVHDTVPPGVPEMKKLRTSIHYSYEETPNGGRVVISSPDKESVAAIHKFLRFQIQKHKTGDPLAHIIREC